MKTIALFFIVLCSVYSVAHARKVMIPKFLRNKIDAAKNFMASQSKELFVREYEVLGIKWVYINTEKDPFYAYGHNNNASFVATWHDGSKVINLEHADIDINEYVGGSRRMNGRHLSALCASDCSDPNAQNLTITYTQWTIRNYLNDEFQKDDVTPYRLCRKDGCGRDACKDDTTYNSGHEWNIDRGLKHYDGDTGCVPCKSGKYNDEQTDYWGGARTPPCKTCANGQHTNNTSGAAICVDTTDTTGSYEGVACPAGKYVEFNETLNLETCKTCKAGFFSSSAMLFKWSCDKCPNGYLSSDDRQSCWACPAGYGFEEKQTTFRKQDCTICAKGFYKGAGGFSCERCPAGKVSSVSDTDGGRLRRRGEKGATQCSQCEMAGAITQMTKKTSKGEHIKYFTECLCPAGKYEYKEYHEPTHTSNKHSCEQCPSGYWTSPKDSHKKLYTNGNTDFLFRNSICEWQKFCHRFNYYDKLSRKCKRCPKFGFDQSINGYSQLPSDLQDFKKHKTWPHMNGKGLEREMPDIELMSFCSQVANCDATDGTGPHKKIKCTIPWGIPQPYSYPWHKKGLVNSLSAELRWYFGNGNCEGEGKGGYCD